MSGDDKLELTLLMPCLNEAKTLKQCITKGKKALAELNIRGEVLVADNGRTTARKKLPRSVVPVSSTYL